MKRWIAVILAVALAGAAVWWLAAGPLADPDERGPHADIDDASRTALEKILEEADRPEARHGTSPDAGSRR